ncbi:MAG TPA: hypothetical protein PKB09_00315 [Candidatus Saccharibacteria bacterium]|nr:hypothetical protein [Candidatus Saccharibacteria bacterium]
METAPPSRPPSFHDFVDNVSPYGDTTVDRSAFVGQYTDALIEYRRSMGIDSQGISSGIEIAGAFFEVEQVIQNDN